MFAQTKADRRPGRVPPAIGVVIAAILLVLAVFSPQERGPALGRAEGAGPRPRAGARKPSPRPSRPKPRSTPKSTPTPTAAGVSTPWVVLGYNELGMHCMNEDFSEICILPPFNTLRAQVIRRGKEPKIVTSGATVSYSIPGNTYSVGKTNFWSYAEALFGVALPPNIGLTGHGLAGTTSPSSAGRKDWEVTGIPITPIMDDGSLNPYALSRIEVTQSGKKMAATQAVVPVSWEISCNLCHNRPGFPSPAADMLEAHDRLHGTNLQSQKPVLCAGCHADPALGTVGSPGVPNMSSAMHLAHAGRFTEDVLRQVGGNSCYACHPGNQTQCQRDIHYARGLRCADCHGGMAAVGDPARTPWVSEPRCADCHHVAGHQYEEPGKLYKESRGHQGVTCAACHGAPHAITPTVTAADNLQAINLQGYAGTINNCVVCHKQRPSERFSHSLDDDDGDD